MRQLKFRPTIQGLESRELLATAVANLVAKPSLLSPPNERYVRVEVTGIVYENNKKLRPQVQYHVVDEYRRIEPSGPVKITRRDPTSYQFKFPVTLQAKRASTDTGGRQYYVIVGTTDEDNSQGLVVPVLVPYEKVSVKKTVKGSTATGGQRMKF